MSSSIEDFANALDKISLVDDQPSIESPSCTLSLQETPDFFLNARGAYKTRCNADFDGMVEIQKLLDDGQEMLNLVYSYRSASKAMPQIKTSEDPNKGDMYEKYFEVLEPEIKKLKDFMLFKEKAVAALSRHIDRISRGLSGKLSEVFMESYVYQLIKLLDNLSILDTLKNMKACLNNDFSFFKRAFQFLRKTMANDDQTQENHTLYLFLAHPNSITTALKEEIQAKGEFDDALVLIANTAAHMMERGNFLTPTEMHRLLRVMPYILFLMDGDKCDVFRSKKINLKRFSALFAKYPIVPMFGDMQVTLDGSIKRCKNFNEKSWTDARSDKLLEQEYQIVHQVVSIRAAHNQYTAKFANMTNMIEQLRRKSPDVRTWDADILRSVSSQALEGMRLVGEWTARVMRQSAWKYAHPNTDASLADLVEYERVVRRNYDRGELLALLEVIGLIKGLVGVMLRQEAVLAPIFRMYIHQELQHLVQVELREMIAAAAKKKKQSRMREEMLALRALAADWRDGVEPNDPVLFGKKETFKPDPPRRVVPPNWSQLEHVRSLVFALLTGGKFNDSGKKTEYSDAGLDSKFAKTLEDFYQGSFFWRHLLTYSDTLFDCSDLSDLWYREFYLEMSNKLQFPIELSLPWILTDLVLESNDPALTPLLFAPLDIYNDCAARALSGLGTQFLFDEVEAELNLCFDQLVFKLAEQVFTHYKIMASASRLDPAYRDELRLVYPDGVYTQGRARYDSVLRMRHVQLLGRSVDLNKLLAQRINRKCRENIEYCIARYEASSITTIVELEIHLAVVRETHRLLSTHLQLDAWDLMMDEANDAVNVTSFHSRILLHTVFELAFDLFPHWVYNMTSERFIPSPVPPSEDVLRAAMPKDKVQYNFGSRDLSIAFENVFEELYQKFFGVPHLLSLLRLIGRSNLTLLVSEVLQNWQMKLHSVIDPYFRELLKGMPASQKLPLFEYLTIGNYGFYSAGLADIYSYPEMPFVLGHFKEVGNTVALFALLNSALATYEAEEFISCAPFLGLTLDNVRSGMQVEENAAKATPLYKAVAASVAYLKSCPETRAPASLPAVLHLAEQADRFHRPVQESTSFFRAVLDKIDDILTPFHASWCGLTPANGVLTVDATPEFYRFWSALQMALIERPVLEIPRPMEAKTKHDNLSLFGDGIFWAGATIMHFLRQEQRFNALDFSYHILKVEEAMPTPSEALKPELALFLTRAKDFKLRNELVFACLRAYYPMHPPEKVLQLHPPKVDVGTQFIQPSEQQQQQQQQQNKEKPQAPKREDAPPPAQDEEEEEEEDEDGDTAEPDLFGGDGDDDDAPPPLPRDDDYDDEDDDDDDDDDEPPPLPEDDDDEDLPPPPLPEDE